MQNQIEDKLGKESADIFRAQEAMLSSSSVADQLKKTLEAKHQCRSGGQKGIQTSGSQIHDMMMKSSGARR